MKSLSNYEKDFYEWTIIQKNLLQNKSYEELDIENLLEEIDSLGKSNKTALKSQLARLLMHQLKLKYQPEMQKNSNSWLNSIIDSKRQIILILEDSPSLKNELKNNFQRIYKYARRDAGIETGLPENTFPEECPWRLNEIFTELE